MKQGDFVSLKSGSQRQIVVGAYNGKLNTSYIHNANLIKIENTLVSFAKGTGKVIFIHLDRDYGVGTPYGSNINRNVSCYTNVPYTYYDRITDIAKLNCPKKRVNFCFGGRVIASYSPNQEVIDDFLNEDNCDDFDCETTVTKGKDMSQNKQKLYQVIGTDIYGYFLTTSSIGDYVLEMRDGAAGTIKSYPKDQVEEVVPWTFRAQVTGYSDYHNFVGQKGSVGIGDILIYGENMMVVVKIDTKSPNAKELKGVKILRATEVFNSYPEKKDEVDVESAKG